MTDRNDLARCISSFGQVQLAVHFGSTAAGHAGPRSDVDIGIRLEVTGHGPEVSGHGPELVGHGLEVANHDLFRQIEVAIGKAFGRPVDLIDLDTAPPQLRFEIARTGVVLLERVPHAWADFRARAMIYWWDWAPTARSLHAAAARRLRRQVMHGSA
jgi:predicted nucleotidyltransferase